MIKRRNKLSSLPLSKININDKFWGKYTKLVKDVIIPYQYSILNDNTEDIEPSHCIRNFKIAAGELEGEFSGAVFQDTDAAKWLEAVAYSLEIEKDDKLEAIADELIDLIGRAQCDDGYINTYFTIKEPTLRWKNLTEGHELYTAGHLIEAAVAYYKATKKDKFLNIVCRFADLICNTFGKEESKIQGYPGHQEIELALFKLYEVTGKKKYSDTAKYFIDERGKAPNYFVHERSLDNYKELFDEFKGYMPLYSQSHLPVRAQETAEGHAVRAVYMYSAMADLSYEYDDDELFNACKRLWDNIVKKRMYITGGIGSSGILERFTVDYDLPNDINYSETCASIGLALFGLRMAKITRDANYIDVVEKALYNTVLSGIAMDGKSFFYVNPLEVWPESCIIKTAKDHVKAQRQKWFGVACCPPNIARTLASLGQYIYMNDEESLYINLFVANKTEVNVGNKLLNIDVKSKYPDDGNIKIHLNSQSNENISVGIRIPSYVEDYSIKINNKEYISDLINGYVMIKGTFLDDEIEVKLDIKPRFVYANPAVRADFGKVAVEKGPLVYCIEEIDNGDNLSAIMVNTKYPIREKYDDKLLGGSTILYFNGKKVNKESFDNDKLYDTRKPEFEEVTLKAVPYCYWGNRKYGEMMVWIKESL